MRSTTRCLPVASNRAVTARARNVPHSRGDVRGRSAVRRMVGWVIVAGGALVILRDAAAVVGLATA